MPDVNQYILDYYNGKLGLAESYGAYAQAVLEKEGQFAFIVVGDTLQCKKCGEPFTVVKKLIKHVNSHLSTNSLSS